LSRISEDDLKLKAVGKQETISLPVYTHNITLCRKQQIIAIQL